MPADVPAETIATQFADIARKLLREDTES
jgi:hypothetical protein